MRLRRLDLTRYGRFTDHSIDFGPRIDDRPDLHLVYGPNEAGKSTAFRALLDLLYGIEMQSPYDFLHSYANMRIGACLELDGLPRELVRVKHAPTLRDGLGQPVPEALLRGAMNGMDRQAYRSMFSLDDDTLESGGESILASKGELGQMLFGSSAGLSDLPAALLGLRQEADGFFRPGGHGTGLKELKNQLAAQKEQREAIDTLASRYRLLMQQRDQAADRMAAVGAERRACQERLEQIGRQLGALPTLATLRRQQAALASLGDVGTAPAAWQAELPRLQSRLVEATTAVALAQATLDGITTRLAACTQDPAALSLQKGLELMQQLGARHQTAVLDLPHRRQDLQSAEAAMRACLSRLGRAEATRPERLLPNAAIAATLRRAIADHAALAANAMRATEEHAAALHAHQAAASGVAEAPPAVEPGAIEPALHALRDSDHAPRGRDAHRRERQHADTLDDTLALLMPWSGDADALLALNVPSDATVMAWQARLDRHTQAAETARDTIGRLEAEAARTAATPDAEAARVPDTVALASLRGLREARWAELRQRLDMSSADAFEAAMRQDDQAAAARLDEARRVARHQELEQAAVRATALRMAEEAKLVEVSRAAAEQRGMLDGVVAGIAAEALPGWLATRRQALAERADLRQARRDAAEAAADGDRLQRALRAALAQAGFDTETASTPAALTAMAEAAMQDAAAARQGRDRASDAAATLAQRATALQAAREAIDAWNKAWQATLDRSWLRELGPDATPAAVGALLDELAALSEPLRSRDDLAGRIRAMESDCQAHADEVGRIAALLDMADAATTEQARRIVDRVDDAMRSATTEAALREAAQQARTALTQAEIALQAPQRQAQAMFAQLNVDSLLAVGEALAEIGRRDQLRRDLAETGATLCTQLGVATMDAAVAALQDADAIALQAERAALQPQAQALEDRLRTLHADRGRAEDAIAAVGGDDAVARLETQRRLVLLQIEDRALDYLRLRAGIAAADRALRAWREQHRSSMLDAASEAFRVITCGAYRGLGTQPDRGGDILVALPRQGGSKAATALSKGCRFQLYLALRAAGHREFARLRQPVPFVADDIMETFDDFRAEESLGVFAGMAQAGQVIYLTHHKHLCDLAERKVPGVRIHELLPAG